MIYSYYIAFNVVIILLLIVLLITCYLPVYCLYHFAIDIKYYLILHFNVVLLLLYS